jgi:TonB family protein
MSIAGFLFASVLLHALCFYIFQIIYPPAVALLPPPGRVNLIAPNSEEGRVLLRWLEAEDPALASTTQPPADGKSLSMPTIQHAPSYLSRQPALREPPPLVPDLRVPSAQPPGPVETPPVQIQTEPKISTTTVRLSPELETLGAMLAPEMKFAASSREAPEAAQFRVAVNESGAVRYCFLENSSGDSALDEQARKYLALCRFSPMSSPASKIENGLLWGTATVEWGNDIAPPTSQPAKP